jgi:excinuclease ABC subunit C
MDVKKRLQKTPASPGIYIMKDSKGKVIYVGKAKHLKNRLRSYFQDSTSLDARKTKMVKEIKSFDYVVTKNELEALVLEANFIKRTKPRYNIILRDDKNYPYLRLTLNEQWPRLEVTRKIVKDGSLYFGPYVPAGSMWETLKFIRRHFQLPSCSYNLEKPFRPCIQYQMGRCSAPCDESMRTKKDRDMYMDTVNDVKLFLKGEKKETVSALNQRMLKLSDKLRFEEAAKLRDRLKAMEKAWETQRVVSPGLGDVDVIGLYREGGEASIFVLFIRNGMVIGRKDFHFKKLLEIDDRELISNFLEQFYSKEILLPPKIILPLKDEFGTQKQWLSNKRGSRITLSFSRGRKESEILKLANENAMHSFRSYGTSPVQRNYTKTLRSLKELLNLKLTPQRIEAVDVSNIAGSEAVGAVVVWENGDFNKDYYRLYKIKTVKGIDDFAMIEEVVKRHIGNLLEKEKDLPRLILIDGGKGQLMSALKALKECTLPVEIAAIAKARNGKTDRIFLHGRTDNVPLEPLKSATHLLQRIRNEVHRVAIRYHKKLRTKRTLESPLEKVHGIGKTRRLSLLRKFGSIDSIRNASVEELASVKGVNRKTAALLKSQIGRQNV